MIHQIKKVIYIAVGITLLIIAIIIGVYCFKQYNILHPAAANAAKVIDSAIIESGELEGAAMECVETVYKASLKRINNNTRNSRRSSVIKRISISNGSNTRNRTITRRNI